MRSATGSYLSSRPSTLLMNTGIAVSSRPHDFSSVHLIRRTISSLSTPSLLSQLSLPIRSSTSYRSPLSHGPSSQFQQSLNHSWLRRQRFSTTQIRLKRPSSPSQMMHFEHRGHVPSESKLLKDPNIETETLALLTEEEESLEEYKSRALIHPLSYEQRMLLQYATTYRTNMFFTGAAGTGKSYLINHLVHAFRELQQTVAITSSTGISAFNIGGTTLHSWAGIGLGDGTAEEMIIKLTEVEGKSARKRWTSTDVLIIDEVSMIDGDLFDKLDFVGRTIRGDDRPFGGLQLIVTGDFFQLPPVGTSWSSIKYAFQADCWKTAILLEVKLTQIFRQKDPTLIFHLNKIRSGIVDSETDEFFRALERPDWEDDTTLTKLLPTRNQVEEENLQNLFQLAGDTHRYVGVNYLTTRENRRNDLAYISSAFKPSIPTIIDLKVGARVMIVRNMIPNRIVNGTTGVVHSFMSTRQAHEHDELAIEIPESHIRADVFEYLTPTVLYDRRFDDLEREIDDVVTIDLEPRKRARLDDPTLYPVVEIEGDLYLIKPMVHRMTELPGENQAHKQTLAARYQLPLILGYALSIHKAQGQTINRVQVNFQNMFAEGQAYVALSRARSLDGLQVLNWDRESVVANDAVREYMANLQVIDGQDEEELYTSVQDKLADEKKMEKGELEKEEGEEEDDEEEHKVERVEQVGLEIVEDKKLKNKMTSDGEIVAGKVVDEKVTEEEAWRRYYKGGMSESSFAYARKKASFLAALKEIND
ncbi:dna repair and recombination protein mitochondrial precursor [Phaffia rhodozyma]|uniref:ATP-dependent DNA helicase n=1 Tax=Phaffia rhodozyma TaxID=264483 RepID=A0A0F7SKB0_PHARH|nr:dna repair and recombination protein mitochondrial precursor [Phaffia rhodozyma]